MFCPQCRYEFKEGITVCPDCRVPLLVELPSKPKVQKVRWKSMKPVDLEAILSTCNPVILALAKSRLEEADIPCLVKNETISGVYLMATGVNERAVQIWVRKNEMEEARGLLQDLLIDS